MSQAQCDPWVDDLRRQLVERRHQLGLTQKNVVYRVGLTQHHLAKYEVGIRTPNAFILACWVQALGARLAVVPLDEAPTAVVKGGGGLRRSC